jgi:hypothetical protein
MKNLKLSLCVLVLASLFCVVTPSAFAQHDDPEPIGPHHIANVEK